MIAKYAGMGLATLAVGYVIVISCPPLPFPWAEDDDDYVAGSSGMAGSAGMSGMGGSTGVGGYGGGLPNHPCTPSEQPLITSAEQLCDAVKSASHCIGVDPNAWTCYCEAELVPFGCDTCLIAFPSGLDLSENKLSEFTEILGTGHSECVRCPQGQNCSDPNSCSTVGTNRKRSIVVGTTKNNCMQ